MQKALASFPPATVMNKTEERYAREILEPKLLAREILWYRFECWKLTLGYKMSYTPDFIVVAADRTIECHEVKAVWSNGKAGFKDDARVKIKTAAEMYPFLSFRVCAWQSPKRRDRRPGRWTFEDIATRSYELPERRTPLGNPSGVPRTND